MPKNKVTLDHKIPVSKGGTDEWNNFQAVHERCNTRKGNKFPDELKTKEVVPP